MPYCSGVVEIRPRRSSVKQMDFTLPASLADKLRAYDPTRPKVTTTRPDAPAKLASIAPCDDLIPFEIVSQADQAAAVAHIRAQPASHRYYRFDGPNDGFRAGLYHVHSTWVALWFAPDGLYGFSYATKSKDFLTDTRARELNWTEKKYGRFKVSVCTHIVRAEDVRTQKMWNRSYWSLLNTVKDYGRTGHIGVQIVKRFQSKLKLAVPYWSDKSWGDLFERLGTDNYVGHSIISGSYCDSNRDFTFDSFVKGSLQLSYTVTESGLEKEKLKSVLERPTIRRFITAKIEDINSKFFDPEFREFYELRAMAEKLTNYVKWVGLFTTIWPQVQLDHLVNYADDLHFSDPPYYVQPNCMDWIRSHMKPDTLFNLLDRAHRADERFEVRDTLRMIQQCAPNLSVPERWRDLHDHVQKESWKIENTLEKLPQDLFAEPVKFDDWTFFQPSDTHQLADWGRNVRNCVGGSSYAEGVRKKRHFIVLCMRSKKPTFTVQLKLESDKLTVTQIVGLSNARLSAAESAMYSTAFSKALSMVA